MSGSSRVYVHEAAPDLLLYVTEDGMITLSGEEYSSPAQHFEVSDFVSCGWVEQDFTVALTALAEDLVSETYLELASARHVRTPEGARLYGSPVGTLIVRDVVRRSTKVPGKALPAANRSRRRVGSVARTRSRVASGARVAGGSAKQTLVHPKVPGLRLLDFGDGTLAIARNGKVGARKKHDLSEFAKLGWSVGNSKSAPAARKAIPRNPEPRPVANSEPRKETPPPTPTRAPEAPVESDAESFSKGVEIRAAEMKAAYVPGSEPLKKFTGSKGSFSVELLEQSDGSKVVRKVDDVEAIDKEFLAGRVANAVGFDDLTTISVPRAGSRIPYSLSTHIEGETGMEYSASFRNLSASDKLATGRSPLSTFTSPDGRKIGLLDWLIDNNDRHDGNYLVREDGSVRPIDHGLAILGARSYGPRTQPRKSVLGTTNSRFTAPMFTGSGAHHDIPVLSYAELGELRVRLGSQEEVFREAGRSDWFEVLQERLALLEKVANKDGSVTPVSVDLDDPGPTGAAKIIGAK